MNAPRDGPKPNYNRRGPNNNMGRHGGHPQRRRYGRGPPQNYGGWGAGSQGYRDESNMPPMPASQDPSEFSDPGLQTASSESSHQSVPSSRRWGNRPPPGFEGHYARGKPTGSGTGSEWSAPATSETGGSMHGDWQRQGDYHSGQQHYSQQHPQDPSQPDDMGQPNMDPSAMSESGQQMNL